MKKTVFALSAIVYLLLSSGLAFSVHYCMGERDTLKLGVTNTAICGRCGMEEDESRGCCHDEHFLVKLTDDQRTTVSEPMPQPPVAEIILTPLPQYSIPGAAWVTETVPFADISPPPLLVSRNILFSNFRI